MRDRKNKGLCETICIHAAAVLYYTNTYNWNNFALAGSVRTPCLFVWINKNKHKLKINKAIVWMIVLLVVDIQSATDGLENVTYRPTAGSLCNDCWCYIKLIAR